MGRTRQCTVVIIGAGFGGIGLGARLKRSGMRDFVILEKAGDLGGTWRDNTYPGAACDIPSQLYSFSFAPNPDWSRAYPPQAEVLDYLRRCVSAFDLGGHLSFGTEVCAAAFDERRARWRMRTTDGTRYEARILVSACGQLNRPACPDIRGLDDFRGTLFHSAQWRHDHDLTGADVAVIGTGASAIQFVPRVAARARRLHVFQRTAPYVIAKHDRRYGPAERCVLRSVPELRLLARAGRYLAYESRGPAFVSAPRLMDLAQWAFRRRLAGQVPERRTRAALTPDYRMGCKRVLISNDYYPALRRDTVELVTEPITRVVPDGIVTADGTRRAVDTIVLGTGFRATEFLAPMRITGAGGVELAAAWRDGAQAYLGITVSGFPNLFLLYGPNTNLGHNSIIYMLESQIRYVLQAVRLLLGDPRRYLDVRPEVQRGFNEGLRAALAGTVWSAGCASWYRRADGTVTNNWSGYTFAYRRRTRRLRVADYRLRLATE